MPNRFRDRLDGCVDRAVPRLIERRAEHVEQQRLIGRGGRRVGACVPQE
jgi:hypothetical protein